MFAPWPRSVTGPCPGPRPRARLHPELGQPFTETTEGLFDARAIEEGRRFTHAASIS
jgi:hypothetical protein